ncbi:MAG: primosomal protein N' [Acidobacteria bacterium]|nr:primosomal protein N' [Acidobacteriota bacterium]
MRLVRVAVPVPGLGLLTYRVPDHLQVQRGMRVVVPVAQRAVTGLVTDHSPDDEEVPARLRDITEVLDDVPFLPEEIVRLALWVGEYYLAGPGEVVSTALPPKGWLRSDMTLALAEDAPSDAEALAEPIEQAVVGTLRARGPILRRQLWRAVAQQTPGAEVTSDQVSRVVRRLLKGGRVRLRPVVTGQADASRRRRWILPTAAAFDHAALRLSAKQTAACLVLCQSAEGLDATVLRDHGIGSEVVRRLVALGLAQVEWRAVERDPFASGAAGTLLGPAGDVFLPLTSEQAEALHTIEGLLTSGFQTALLHGVTGSGKTQVYLRLAQATLAQGRGVLLLVPEIALTPAVASLFRRAFGGRVAIQHSGLSDGERYDQWHRIRRGEVDVVVGTRSAVFAPLPRLGLVIVDEEHDTAYKQEESPRYHGRDAALVRARDAGAVALLGSATPSLESWRHASEGRYTLVRMLRRVHDRPLAQVTTIDMRGVFAEEGPEVVLSRSLRDALLACLERREQAMVLLNRRGYAPSLFCRACGNTPECPNCSVTLTVHRKAAQTRCHYCGYTARLPTRCASCQGEYLEYTGVGTERVEQEVARACPRARIARVDRDTMQRRGAIAGVLSRFAAREIDVLVGTQMIAKGHDFPQVTLVGVVSADIGLGVADFRAAERTFQLLTQVAGRAGRGEIPGVALVQTLHPQHYAIELAARQAYDEFVEREMEFRQRMRYPPWLSLINVVVRHASLATAMKEAGQLAEALRRLGDERFGVLGPAPAPLGRLRGESRVQLFLKGRDRTGMRQAAREALAAMPTLHKRVTIDVDPVSML